MDSLDSISQIFNLYCTFTHTSCNNLSVRTTAFVKNGGQISNDFFSKYLEYIQQKTHYYYSHPCYGRKDIHEPCIKEMLSVLDISKSNIINLIQLLKNTVTTTGNSPYDAVAMFDIINKKNKGKLDSKILHEAVKSRHVPLIYYLLNKCVATKECLEDACTIPHSSNLIQKFLDQKVEISMTAIKNAIAFSNFDIASKFIEKITPDVSCLATACSRLNLDLINKILHYKIVPNQECFNALLQHQRVNYYYADKQSTDAFKVAKLIDVLIYNGYKITYDDVVFALEHGCFINDIQRFDFKFKTDFLERCAVLGYYPYPNLDIKPTLKCLEVECGKANNVPNIKKMLASNPDLKPDVKCLEKACDHRSNITNIRYLVEVHGVKPNNECLKVISKHLRNSTLTFLLSHMDDISADKEANKEKNKIKKPKNIKKPEPDNDIMKEYHKIMKNHRDLINQKKRSVKKEKKNDHHEIEEEHEKIEDGNKISKEDPTTKISENESKYQIIKITINNKKNIGRDKYPLYENAAKLFKIKNNQKVNIVDTRKYLISYINVHKLIDQDKKDLIKPNKELCKYLNIKEGQFISFNDIDNIAYNMLKIEK